MSSINVDPTLYFASFLAATFAAALVAGLAGFAFGLVAAAVWLHILTPLQTATLIVVFGLIVQGYSVWKLRAALNWSRLWPFLLGELSVFPSGLRFSSGRTLHTSEKRLGRCWRSIASMRWLDRQ